MEINGCHIVATINADSPDGFSAMVSRYVGFGMLPYVIPPDAVKVTKGPFLGIQAAVTYAHAWRDANNPPEIPSPPVPVVPTPETPPEPAAPSEAIPTNQ